MWFVFCVLCRRRLAVEWAYFSIPMVIRSLSVLEFVSPQSRRSLDLLYVQASFVWQSVGVGVLLLCRSVPGVHLYSSSTWHYIIRTYKALRSQGREQNANEADGEVRDFTVGANYSNNGNLQMPRAPRSIRIRTYTRPDRIRFVRSF